MISLFLLKISKTQEYFWCLGVIMKNEKYAPILYFRSSIIEHLLCSIITYLSVYVLVHINMYMCVYVYVCMCIYIYIYIYMYMYVCVCIYVYVYIYLNVLFFYISLFKIYCYYHSKALFSTNMIQHMLY